MRADEYLEQARRIRRKADASLLPAVRSELFALAHMYEVLASHAADLEKIVPAVAASEITNKTRAT